MRHGGLAYPFLPRETELEAALLAAAGRRSSIANLSRLWLLGAMKASRIPPLLQAFSRIDLAVVLAVLAMLTLLAFPVVANGWSRSLTVECVNNLRRIGQGFHVWASDHGDKFPWSVPASDGGIMGLSYYASDCFKAISNELRTPSFLVCPTDASKVRLNRFDASVGYPSDMNVSYFAGTLASMTHGRTWLSGDRNVNPAGAPNSAGWLVIYPDRLLNWDATLHAYAGNLLRADGSVRQLTQTGLAQSAAQAAAQNTNGLIEILKP